MAWHAKTILTYFANRELRRHVAHTAYFTEAIWNERLKIPADAILVCVYSGDFKWSRMRHVFNLQEDLEKPGSGVVIFCDSQPIDGPAYPDEGAAMEPLRRYILREIAQGHPDSFNAVARPGESYAEFRAMPFPKLLPVPR